MINTYYGGNTQSFNGASTFSSNVLIKIEEGYTVGSTFERVSIGEYTTIDLQNNGAGNQTIDINAISSKLLPNNNSSLIYRNLTSGDAFFSRLKNSGVNNDFSSNFYLQSGDWEEKSAQVGPSPASSREDALLSNPTSVSEAYYSGNDSIRDSKVGVRFAVTSTAALGTPVLRTRWNPNSNSGYQFSYSYATNRFSLDRQDNGVATNLGATTITLGRSPFYWLNLITQGQHLIASYSSNGVSYAKLFDVYDYGLSGSDLSHFEGQIGLAAPAGNYNLGFFDFSLIDLDRTKTREDVIREGLAMSQAGELKVSDEQNLLPPSTLGTWTDQSANGNIHYALTNTSIGDSWYNLKFNLRSDDFVFESEILGTSGNRAGIGLGNVNPIVGTSASWYCNYFLFSGSSRENSVENYMQTRNTYRGQGDHLSLQPNQWYKLRVVKEGFLIRWYVNDVLSNSINGTSLFDSEKGESVNPMLFGYRAGVSATQTLFRNIRVSQLDDLVSPITVEPNTTLDSLVNRYIPNGYAVIHGVTYTQVFQIGTSRGSLGAVDTVSDFTGLPTEGEDYTAGNKIAFTINDKAAAFVQVDSGDMLRQRASSSKTSVIVDDNFDSETEAGNAAQIEIDGLNRKRKPIYLDTKVNPLIEPYDHISLGATTLSDFTGRSLLISSFTKSFSNTGPFRQSLILEDL